MKFWIRGLCYSVLLLPIVCFAQAPPIQVTQVPFAAATQSSPKVAVSEMPTKATKMMNKKPIETAKKKIAKIQKKQFTQPKTENYLSAVDFSKIQQIVAEGNIHLKINIGAPRFNISDRGLSSSSLERSNVRFEGNTLYLSANSGVMRKTAPINLRIDIPAINKISVSGMPSVYIQAKRKTTTAIEIKQSENVIISGNFTMPVLALTSSDHIYTRGQIDIQHLYLSDADEVFLKGLNCVDLHIDQLGGGEVSLDGYMAVAEITQSGRGFLNAAWLRGGLLQIQQSDRAQLKLAGAVTKLVANLTDHAVLNATYLKTQSAYIMTNNDAFATLGAKKLLFASAKDDSQIRYTGFPKNVERNSNLAGQILAMSAI